MLHAHAKHLIVCSQGLGVLHGIHAGMHVGVEAGRHVQPRAAKVVLHIDEGQPAAALGAACLLGDAGVPCKHDRIIRVQLRA